MQLQTVVIKTKDISYSFKQLISSFILSFAKEAITLLFLNSYSDILHLKLFTSTKMVNRYDNLVDVHAHQSVAADSRFSSTNMS